MSDVHNVLFIFFMCIAHLVTAEVIMMHQLFNLFLGAWRRCSVDGSSCAISETDLLLLGLSVCLRFAVGFRF